MIDNKENGEELLLLDWVENNFLNRKKEKKKQTKLSLNVCIKFTIVVSRNSLCWNIDVHLTEHQVNNV